MNSIQYKHTALAVLVLYGCLLLTATSQAARPILVWNFDEASGTVAVDSSGNGRDGTIQSSVLRNATGSRGQGSSLEFTGGKGSAKVVTEPSAPEYLNGLETLTCAIWVNADFKTRDLGCFGFVAGNSDQGGIRYDRAGWRSGGVQLVKASLMTTNGEIGFEGTSGTTTTEWQHLAMVWESGEGLSLYIDGEPDIPANYHGSRVGAVAGVEFLKVGIGALNNNWDGLLDEMLIYDVAMSAAEIKDLYANGYSVDEPGLVSPPNKRALDETSATLTWLPSGTAVSHRLYFSENFDAVNDRDAGALVPGAPQSTYAVDGLERAKNYYWRVDAVAGDGSILGTEVWSFSVKDIKAYAPIPSDGATYVSSAQMLSWQYGVDSVADVFYIGTDADVVAQATGGTPQIDPNYTPDTPFAEGTTYYWRVDELNKADEIVPGNLWNFTTVPAIPIEDESLLGWWKFDIENATSALDSSGHGLHGILGNGIPEWVPGVNGLAMQCSGTYYQTPAPDVNVTSATMSGWIMPTGTTARGNIVGMGQYDTALAVKETNQLVSRWGGTMYDPNLVVPMFEWSFVAAVVEPNSRRLYLNRTDWFLEDTELENAPVMFNDPLWLGAAGATRFLNATIDDVRFYTRALSNEELDALIQAETLPVEPVDANLIVLDDFDSYKSYFNQPSSDPNVWDVWMDGYGGNGTGSTVAHWEEPVMERLITADGGQSLPIYYDNTGSGNLKDYEGNPITATYSEISRAFSPALEFTVGGAKTLVFWIYGDLDNTAEVGDDVSLELTDGTQTVSIPAADSSQLLQPKWQKVEVLLASLAFDLTKITEIRLIIGQKYSADAGGIGVVFVDNIVMQR